MSSSAVERCYMWALRLGGRKDYHYLSYAVLVILLPLTLFGCISSPPRSFGSPPPYPAATRVVDENLTGKGLYHEQASINRRITFETSDTPDVVIAYYRDALVKDGWRPDDPVPITATHTFLWFSNSRSPEMYLIDVTAENLSSNQTRVRVEFAYFAGY